MLETALFTLAYFAFTLWVFSLFYRVTLTEEELGREFMGEPVQRRAICDLMRSDARAILRLMKKAPPKRG